tara:strand:- start:2380 stop:2622 length:243 start_codon:yes stop_codon:yes gene_type:complete
MPNTKAIGVAYEDQQLDGAIIGKSGGTVGFYGKTPVTQRSSSVQATSNLATSASFGATQLAAVQEIMNTLASLGLWKGSV